MALSDPLAASMPVRRARLDNGLTVLVQEVHTAPLVSVWCWFGVGSSDEAAGLTGVSHWVEHMNFKGTTNIPRDQVKGIIEQFGGSWNGYTWIDQTTYLETATRVAARIGRALAVVMVGVGGPDLAIPADFKAAERVATALLSQLPWGAGPGVNTVVQVELSSTS